MPKCPTPHKHKHRSPGSAMGQLRSMQRAHMPGSEDLNVYPCVCGSWHVGNPSLNDKIRRALRRRR